MLKKLKTPFKPDYRAYPDMGQINSDPQRGERDWCECTKCKRPTRMTGTKLCDSCWQAMQHQVVNRTITP